MKHRVGGLVRVGRVIAVLTLAAAAMSACGGSSKAKDAAADKPQDQEVGAEATTTTSKATPKATKKDARAGSSDDVTTTTTTAPAKAAQAKGDPNAPRLSVPDTMPNDGKKLDIRVELAEACVRPGTKQTITIHAKPDSGVAYNTYYADGKHGLSEGYYGGNNGGYTDKQGTYSDTWVLAPNAAPGRADIAILGAHGTDERGEARASFQVARLDGSCG